MPDSDYTHDEENANTGDESNPIREMLSHMFSGARPAMFDHAKERAAYDKSKDTAIRVAAALLPARHHSVKAFVDGMNELFFVPLRANPLVVRDDVVKMAKALQEKTGTHKESDTAGQPPHEEVWSEALHDIWFEHVCEHAGWNLWVHLPGPIDKKEDLLEEMLPLVEKFGHSIAVMVSNYRHNTDLTSAAKTPLQIASDCASQAIKDLLVTKARQIGAFKM